MSVLATDEKRLGHLRKLTEVSRALTYAVALSEVLDLTVSHAAELLETDRAVLMLMNDDGLLSIRAAHGLDPQVTERFREPLDETLIGRLRGLLDVDAAHFLGVPLVVGAEVTGILAVSVRGSERNAHDDEWLLSALADQAAVALEKTRLDESAEFRERLIGIVSHDLRNPIGAILVGSALLLRADGIDATSLRVVSRIHSSAERAARMIRDLLDYTQARLGNGIEVHKSRMDLRPVVRQVIDELQILNPTRRIELQTSGDPTGEWDSDRLAQVLGNLLSNAVQYSDADSDVHVTLHAQVEAIVLAVHSQGKPIPRELQARIFEPMQRAAGELTGSSRSVGLGLYIVRSLVAAHNGTVGVESTEEAGTTFTVTLPRRPRFPPSGAPTQRSGAD